MKPVVVYTLHEHEQGLARAQVKDGAVTDRMVIGNVDDETLEMLRKEGLVVKVLEELDEKIPFLPGEGAAEDAAPFEQFAGVAAEARSAYWVYLAGPPIAAWRKALEGLRVEILGTGGAYRRQSNEREEAPRAASGYRLHTKMPMAAVSQVRQLPFVRRVTAVEPRRRQAMEIMVSAQAPQASPLVATYDVRVGGEAQLQQLLDMLRARNVLVVGTSRLKVRLQVLEADPLLDELRRIEGVLVEKVEPIELHNDHARALVRVDAGPAALGLQGDQEIIAIADTGLDDTHPDFAGRIAGLKAFGRPNVTTDPHGHGTHVAGTALGSGVGSNGAFRGAAPHAHLYLQSLLDSQGGLTGLPMDLANLFDDAYQVGARVHNNSWGALSAAEYRMRSLEVDEFVRSHPDMVVVISAGNAGTDLDPPVGRRSSQRGYCDWYSLGTPATAKNAICVGASRSDRTTGGHSAVPHGTVWQTAFRDPPIRNETVSGNPNEVAGFSSRGPCKELRIKPDLVAPGTDVFSCRSSTAPLRRYSGLDPLFPTYGYMSGTSMAAPLVAGSAALVREYFRTQRHHRPSAALVKAVLVNSTKWLPGLHAVADHGAQPNVHQGFGLLDMSMAVPTPQNGIKLEFYDNWENPAEHFSADGRGKRFRVDLSADGWIRICLAYTDAPGRGLQNNLSVLFEPAPRGQKLFGNDGGQFGSGQPDALNNVECIRVANAVQGSYYIHVIAEALLRPPQDFALVVTGNTLQTFTTEF